MFTRGMLRACFLMENAFVNNSKLVAQLTSANEFPCLCVRCLFFSRALYSR